MERILGGQSGFDRSPPPSAAPLSRQDTPRRDGDGTTWSEFLHFYSRGAWDPQKVPVMPKRPGAKRGPSLPLNSSAATQSPVFSVDGPSEPTQHAPPTLIELVSSQLNDSLNLNMCSLLPRPSVSTQSVIPQGDDFESLGYLAAPFAPHELDRRRALYRFNVLHSARDPNFDRIVHLAKMVFGTKIALIALVDDDEQWFKAESGLGRDRTDRRLSFCAHTILQPNSEPLVVFDTHQDWRFRNNPLVKGPPSIRFYAGAPLRTSSGFNIGSLCIIDDQPRTFSSREKHQLKEFAAIVMRELELFRDKIHLKVKDRMQESLEQFTRDCLETDSDEKPINLEENSMDRVYEKAASLAKRTLSLDGALVVDISSFHTAEKTHRKDSMTATVYHSEDMDQQNARLQVSLSEGDYDNVVNFFDRFPDGHIYHDRFPLPFMQHVLPQRAQYALVPVHHGTGQLPFALLCVYTQQPKWFLERFDLIYLRAIGVVLLSAVLKRKMHIADRAKTLFISNISHELRTPLHGILAAAELLDNGSLDSMQSAYLQSIRSCGQSLAETVDHVLEFQKLSGAAVDAIATSPVDLLQLVEEAAECGWMGAKAIHEAVVDLDGDTLPVAQEDTRASTKVELVIDVEHRNEGWDLRCEKNGLRRILLNVLSNAIKFTEHGHIHILVRRTEDGLCSLTIVDSGKGMSAEFIRNGLFRPFSQEDPLRNGTGLGLAIVKAISDRMSGDLQISSVEGYGTTVSLVFPAEQIIKAPKPAFPPVPFRSVVLYGYNENRHGSALLQAVTTQYLAEWWGLRVLKSEEDPDADLIIINESLALFRSRVQRRQIRQPIVLLMSTRRDLDICKSNIAEFENAGGVSEIVFKPSGPLRLHCALVRAAQKHAQVQLQGSGPRDSGEPPSGIPDQIDGPITKLGLQDEELSKFRVLCVEDNSMLRRILVQWLKSKDIPYAEASDGLEAVACFEQHPPNYFDILLVDISMPRLDGVGATKQIRDIESKRNAADPNRHSRVKIVALTGMSTVDDKRRAFEAGVDDYFVKPVSFKTLNAIFTQLRS